MTYVSEVHPLTAPAPPTKPEREPLQLGADGMVAIIRHLHGETDVRVPSVPSMSRCGHLGRKVASVAERLKGEGLGAVRWRSSP